MVVLGRADLFLRAVLGAEAASAMKRIAKSSDFVAGILVPRAVMGWLRRLNRYHGAIPGVANSELILEKSEGTITGSMHLPTGTTDVKDAPIETVAAPILVALGAHMKLAKTKDVELARLGLTVDRMLEVREIQLRKAQKGPHKGVVAAPLAPEEPEPKEDFVEEKAERQKNRAKSKPRLPHKTKEKEVKLSRSEMAIKCGVCGASQFSNNSSFVGCFCVRDLAKSVSVISVDKNGAHLKLGSKWDTDAIITLMEATGRNEK